ALARATKRSYPYGAFLDSTFDRMSEGAIYVGMAAYFLDRGGPWVRWEVLACLLALAGSFLVSYVRARAQSLGFRCDSGVFARPERVVVTVAGLVTGVWWVVGIVVGLLAVLTNLTAVQRILEVWAQAREQRRAAREAAQAAAELAGQLVGSAGEVQPFQRVPGARGAAVRVVQPRHQLHQLTHPEVLVEHRRVRHERDQPARLHGARGLAADGDLAGRRVEQAGGQAQQRGLAGAVVAEQDDQLARLHRQVQRPQRPGPAVLLDQPLGLQHRARRRHRGSESDCAARTSIV